MMNVYFARVTIQNPLIADVPYPTYATIEAVNETEAKGRFIKYLQEAYGKCREVHVDLKSIIIYPFIR